MLLREILDRTRRLVDARQARQPLAALSREARRTRRRSLKARLAGSFGVIAELKKASPSAGLIVPRYRPASIARAYEAAGAAGISVLTCRPFFLGDIGHLRRVRLAVDLPILRKDFIIDPYQVAEAAAAGADVVLLIVRILDDALLASLARSCRAFGVETLIEVHDEEDLARALRLDAWETAILGINNRDLATLKTDAGTTLRLLKRVPLDTITVISESGLGPAESRRMAAAGLNGVLVGSSLLSAPDIARALPAYLP